MGQGGIASAQASYAWLLDVLLGEPPATAWAPAGGLPASFTIAEEFGVFPAIAGRSLLISLRSRQGTASALTSYNSLRAPRTRFVRRVLGAGLRIGLVQPLLPGRIDVGTSASATGQPLAHDLLTQQLSELFGRDQVVVAISGGEGPFRKPVLQVFSTDGTPLGFVKVGWNSWTREALGREAAGLRACANSAAISSTANNSTTSLLGAPALIGQYTWRGLDLLVTAPIPKGARRVPVRSDLPDVRVLREINELSDSYSDELASSPWWLGLRTRILSVADPKTRAEIDEAANRIEQASGQVRLQFGTWHGDFVPWNLARIGTRLFAWDWESSASDAPVGFDALHFHFQVAFVAQRRPVDEAARAALKACPALELLGVPAAAHRLVAALHLLELCVSHAVARGSGAGTDDRFYPAAIRVLDHSPTPSAKAGQLHSSGRCA